MLVVSLSQITTTYKKPHIMTTVNKLNKGQREVMFQSLNSQVEKGFRKFFTNEENRNFEWLKNNR